MKNLYDIFIQSSIDIIKPTVSEIEFADKKIKEDLKNYVKNANLKSLVIGISGGLDSAIVAAQAREVCDDLNIKLLGVSIPISSSNIHKEQAAYIGNKYCHAFEEINDWESKDIHVFNEVETVINQTDRIAQKAGFNSALFDNRVAQGNIKARMRMTTLYRLAGVTNGAVLSTDNFSEYFLGFWTINGDVGDISPIQFVEKGTEEIELAKYLDIREDIIFQKPSDGLNVSDEDTDEAQLGLSYKEIGPIMFAYMNMLPEEQIKMFNEIKKMDKVKSIIERHEKTSYKRNGPYFIKREKNGFPIRF